jgi:hypothetical protein
MLLKIIRGNKHLRVIADTVMGTNPKPSGQGGAWRTIRHRQ